MFKLGRRKDHPARFALGQFPLLVGRDAILKIFSFANVENVIGVV